MEDQKWGGFYEAWSSKSPDAIVYDIEASIRKADVISSLIPAPLLKDIQTVLDFGCGYGALTHRIKEQLKLSEAIGVDFSATAINVARQRYEQGSLKYCKLPGFDIFESEDFLRSTIPDGVDCIMLIDLLEHVPDCKHLVAHLSKFTRYFIIKLPVESSIFDNYVLPKEYPSSVHSNGHLREFDANGVYYFIRQLGLTPLFESLYIYHLCDTFPPLPPQSTFRQRAVRWLIRGFKGVAARILPMKIFLRWIGGGGYVCLATFDQAHVLNP